MLSKHIELKNYQELLDAIKDFDKHCGTTTYIAKTNLDAIGRAVKKDYDWVCEDIGTLIRDMTISCGNHFTTQHKKANADLLEKTNTISIIAKEIAKGGRIRHPMSLHYFGKKVGLHPGQSRLYFQRVYPYPIHVICTDYKGDIKEKFPYIKFDDPRDHEFSVKNLQYNMYSSFADSAARSLKKIIGDRLCYIHEVKELYPPELADPTLYENPKTFRKEKNRFYVDNQLVYQQHRNSWKVTIDIKNT